MALLAVQSGDGGLSFRQGTLTVTRAGTAVQHVPLHDVDEVQLYGPVQLSAKVRNTLLERKIRVLLLDGHGRYLGAIEPPGSRSSERRVAQLRHLSDVAFRLPLAAACVRGKLANMASFLRHGPNGSKRPESVAAAIVALRRALNRLEKPPTIDVVRGIEGYATRLYFAAFGAKLNHPDIAFTGRNRRPPRDPANACLSFGYTMLLTKVEAAVRKAGLDPYVGALHDVGRGKPALVLDLMEEFRPLVVDRLVARLVNRRQLNAYDFEVPTQPNLEVEDKTDRRPAIYLGPTGRSVLLRELGQVWRRPHHYRPEGRKRQLGAIVDAQAQAMARAFVESKPEYQPFLLP